MTPHAPHPGGQLQIAGQPLHVLLFAAALVMNMFSGNSGLIGLPIGPDRVLFAAAIVLFWRAEQDRRLALGDIRPLHLLMLTMSLWTASSAVIVGTFFSRYGVFAVLDRVVMPYAFFVIAPLVFNTPERRRLLARTLVLMGIYLGVTAIFEMVGLAHLVFPSYIADPDVGIQYGRARGPFVESEADGLVMLACAAAGALVALRGRGVWRLLGSLAFAACLVGCFLTLTRSIWIGCVLGFLLVGVTSPRMRKVMPVLAGVGAVGVVLALQVVPGLHQDVSSRGSDALSVMDRQNTNAAALRIIRAHPLAGVGWMRFLDVGEEWVRQSDDYPITNVHIEVHNVVLSRAAELGVPGAALWIGTVLAGPLAAGFRKQRGDLEDWRLVFLGTFPGWATALMVSPVPYPLPTFLIWIFAGILYRRASATTSEEELAPAQRALASTRV